MRFLSKTILRFVIGLGCIFSIGFGQQVVAKDYPDHPVRVVVPWPPGGLVDIAGRAAVKTLQSSLGQPFIIDNKVGAGGNLGSDAVAKSPADGYTLMLTGLQPRVLLRQQLLMVISPYR